MSPHVCFILVLILISMCLRSCINELGIFHANRTTKCLRNQGRTKGEGWSTANYLKPPSNFIAGRPKAALLFCLLLPFLHFTFYLAHFIAFSLNVFVCLVYDFSIVATCPSIQRPTLLFVCVLFVLFLLFIVVFW